MNLAEILEGAQAWARNRRDITYQMGGEDIRKDGKLDCSAFAWTVLGEKKKDRNTDWIRADAVGRKSRFRQIAAPVPGCIAVYGSRWEKTPAGATKRHAGHVGFVVDPEKKLAIDCSSSQNGIRLHRQSVLFDGPSDKRTNGLIFCVPVEATDAPIA
jgi:hypothetical protein